jgi:hypothetical protein
MIGNKGFIQRFAGIEIDIFHPIFRDEGFDQLTKNGFIGEQFSVAAIVDFFHCPLLKIY